MNSGRKIVMVLAATVAAGIAGACTHDAAARPDVAGPSAPLGPGSRLSGTSRLSVLVLDSTWGGAAAAVLSSPSADIPARPFRAEMRNGTARDDSGLIVATTRRLGSTHRSHAFVDKDGHANELVLSADSPDQPVRRVRIFRDANLAVDVTYDWTPRAGGWVLNGRTTTIFEGGRPILRTSRTVADVTVARAGLGSQLGDLARAGSAALGPARLEAQLLECLGYDLLVGLTGALAVYTGIALVQRPNIGNLAAFIGALWTFEKAMDEFVSCMET